MRIAWLCFDKSVGLWTDLAGSLRGDTLTVNVAAFMFLRFSVIHIGIDPQLLNDLDLWLTFMPIGFDHGLFIDLDMWFNSAFMFCFRCGAYSIRSWVVFMKYVCALDWVFHGIRS